ncbi:MAG: pyridoxal-phosphate dependent enzyme [Rickettsiales bacterium]|jgi:cysteine synthase B|nr:pyridoxal-phosphate dependent enzyme [Rickettsiales bacterium]
MILESVLDYIGDTPLLKIPEEVHGVENAGLYAKCELFNPFGSVKDRTALALVRNHIGELKASGKTFLESSSGNTAKAMQVILSMHGVGFKTITNRIKTPEVRDILLALGTRIDELPGLSECPDLSDPNDPITFIENLIAQNPGKYLQNSQYYSRDNPEIHRDTGREIAADLGGAPDYFFGMLGTTGSTRGISEFLCGVGKDMKTIGVVAAKGNYLPGVRNIDEMFEVGLFDRKIYADIVEVFEDEAVLAMSRLNRRCGLLCGPTTGGAFAAAAAYLKKLAPKKPVKAVFVACDRIEWYMSFLKKKLPEMFDAKRKFGISCLVAEDMEHVSSVPADGARQWMAENNPLVIDLRGNTAFKASHIPNSINIVDSMFEEVVQYSPPFSNGQKVLLVCPVGQKSRMFSALLYKKGFTAYSLDGGFAEYIGLGGKTESSGTACMPL